MQEPAFPKALALMVFSGLRGVDKVKQELLAVTQPCKTIRLLDQQIKIIRRFVGPFARIRLCYSAHAFRSANHAAHPHR